MINIKAQQTLVKFNKQDAGTLRYVMRPEKYSQLAENKVIAEAAVRSGIAKGALKGAWDAIGEVIKAWVTEGHSVAIPGLGTLRFGINAQAVEDVNDVAKGLIRTRKVVFTPSALMVTTMRTIHRMTATRLSMNVATVASVSRRRKERRTAFRTRLMIQAPRP